MLLNYEVDFGDKILTIHEKRTPAAMADIRKVTDWLVLIFSFLGLQDLGKCYTEIVLLVEKKLESNSC